MKYENMTKAQLIEELKIASQWSPCPGEFWLASNNEVYWINEEGQPVWLDTEIEKRDLVRKATHNDLTQDIKTYPDGAANLLIELSAKATGTNESDVVSQADND